MKLTRKQGQFIFVLLMALFMSCAMAFALTFVRLGFEPGFVRAWLRAWGIGLAVCIPTALVVLPAVGAIVAWLTR